MKYLLLGCLSALLMSTAAIKAETVDVNSGVSNCDPTQMSVNQPRPFDLVSLAYEGYFSKEGIPSHDNLIAAYQSGQVTPRVLVQSAIRANRLSPNCLSNKDYLSAVGFQLRELRIMDRGH